MALQSSPPISLNDIYNEASANGYTGARSLNALRVWSGWTNLPSTADSITDFLGIRHINSVETTLRVTLIRVVNNSSVHLLDVGCYIVSNGLIGSIFPDQSIDVLPNASTPFTNWGTYTDETTPGLGVLFRIWAEGNTLGEMSNIKTRVANSVSNGDGLPFPNTGLVRDQQITDIASYLYPEGNTNWADVGSVPAVCVLDYSFDVIFEDIV